MKKISVLIASILVTGAAMAQPAAGGFTANAKTPSGGFTGSVTVVTAEQAKTLSDNAKVTLRGTIERHVGGENYIFKDASGTIEVEIDDRRWEGQTVAPQDRIEIFGEVDKNWTSVEIDVKKLRKL
jgi:uncharacterized protein (TIGR00156 family)